MNKLFAGILAAFLVFALQAKSAVITPPFNPANSIPGISNFTAINLPNWRKARANVRTGNADAIILEIGDSTSRGERAGSPDYTNAIAGAHSARIAAILTNAGLTTNTDSIFGASNYSQANMLATDPRLTMGADWSLSVSTTVTLGGEFFQGNSTGTTSLNFAPTAQFDTIRVCYVQNGTNGSFTISVDSGAALGATVNSSGTATYICTTRTTTLGTHTINLQRTTGGTIFIASIEAWNSITHTVRYLNAGWGGSKAADWSATTNVWSAFNTIATIQPNLTIINLGINDWTNGTSIATWTAQMQSIITKAKTYGDVIICVPAPSNTTRATLAAQAAIATAIYSLAATNNLPVVDWTYRMGSYSSANAIGEYTDDLHPNALGQADMAEPLAKILLGP